MSQQGEYGGFWIRLLAFVADVAILIVATIVILVAASFTGPVGVKIGGFAALLLQLFYFPVMQASARQATYGKAMLGLKVAHSDGERISFLRSSWRELAKLFSFLPLLIGFLMAAFTQRKQALHDFMASTCVERDGPAHIAGAVVVAVVGIVGPMIAIPLIGMAVFMGIIASLFGDLVGEVRKIAPQIQIQVPAPKSSLPKAPVATQTPAPAPAPQATGIADADFDRFIGAPLTGLEKPGTTRAGPAILELSTMFTSSVWVKVHLPVPAIAEPELMPAPRVTVNRVLDQAGANYHDPENTFEKSDFFRRPALSPRSSPVPHLSGTRSVHLSPGLTENALQRIEGQLDVTLPVDPKALAFEAGETGKEKSAHDSTVVLVSLTGAAVRLRYRGPSQNLLTVRAFGVDGQPVAFESRQILPQNQPVDQEFTVSFRAAPARIEAVIAARLIERSYPFSVVKGAIASPPPAR